MTIRGFGPLSLIFANQFKCLTWEKLRVFILKLAISGPHQPFCERNAITRAVFTIIWHSTSKGPRAQMVRLFLVFTYIWQKDDAKISKVPRAPRNINTAQAITWLVDVSCIVLLCSIGFQNSHIYTFYFGLRPLLIAKS